eukprot:1142608-Pelagomonas_calceolata.AAC.3
MAGCSCCCCCLVEDCPLRPALAAYGEGLCPVSTPHKHFAPLWSTKSSPQAKGIVLCPMALACSLELLQSSGRGGTVLIFEANKACSTLHHCRSPNVNSHGMDNLTARPLASYQLKPPSYLHPQTRNTFFFAALMIKQLLPAPIPSAPTAHLPCHQIPPLCSHIPCTPPPCAHLRPHVPPTPSHLHPTPLRPPLISRAAASSSKGPDSSRTACSWLASLESKAAPASAPARKAQSAVSFVQGGRAQAQARAAAAAAAAAAAFRGTASEQQENETCFVMSSSSSSQGIGHFPLSGVVPSYKLRWQHFPLSVAVPLNKSCSGSISHTVVLCIVQVATAALPTQWCCAIVQVARAALPTQCCCAIVQVATAAIPTQRGCAIVQVTNAAL